MILYIHMRRLIPGPTIVYICLGVACGFAIGYMFRDSVYYQNRSMPTIILQRPEDWQNLFATTTSGDEFIRLQQAQAREAVCEPIIQQITKEIQVPIETTCEPQIVVVREPCPLAAPGEACPNPNTITARDSGGGEIIEQERTVQVVDQDCQPGDRYCNGDYSMVVEYEMTSDTTEYVNARVVIVDDRIEYATASYGASNDEVQEWQSRFDNDFRELLINKNPEQVSLSRVGGASVTTNAYNDALDAIVAYARN